MQVTVRNEKQWAKVHAAKGLHRVAIGCRNGATTLPCSRSAFACDGCHDDFNAPGRERLVLSDQSDLGECEEALHGHLPALARHAEHHFLRLGGKLHGIPSAVSDLPPELLRRALVKLKAANASAAGLLNADASRGAAE
jgi:hypothetical protein